MVDTTDLTIRDSVRREASEELNANPMGMEFNENFRVMSFITQDSGRYNPETSKHRLRTSLFHVKYSCSDPNLACRADKGLKAGDDASAIEIVPIKNLFDVDWISKNVMPGHIPLLYYWLGQLDGDRYF